MDERPSRTTRNGQTDSVPPSRPVSNVFGDEYEVVDIEPSDGFRPDNDRASVRSYTPSEPYSFASSSRIQSSAAHVAADPRMTIAPHASLSRNSTRKSQSQQNPFASSHDADDEDDVHTPLARSPSVRSQNFAPGDARRSFSSASSRQFAPTSSRLGSGPSHPYTMYPQGTMARTASSATSAAVGRSHGSMSSRTGPAHPYGMYTQGVTQSDDDEDDNAQNPVPVGFGLGQPYRRVRGPEGEEQDIIGDYGHAEQLPPYTRYADDGIVKTPLIAEPEASHTRSPIEGTDPAMPLMHERLAQRQSMTDASQLEQSAPLLADTASSTEASTLGKKSWKDKNWSEKKKTRICGVRFSVCLIILGVMAIIFAALVGSLVGYLAGVKNKVTTSAAPSSSYYDASIIPTPTNSMPSGSYALSLGTPQVTQAQCLTDPGQRAAWNCNLAGKPAVAISIGLPPRPTPTMGALIFYASADTNISYGAQYQDFSTDYAQFYAVQDNDNSSLGPAFYFSQTYNKVVVVPESAFSTAHKQRRWWQAEQTEEELWQRDFSRKGKASPGDKPWFCVFNNTLLEGFIYVSKPASLSTTQKTSSVVPSSSSITSSAFTGPITSAPYVRPSATGDNAGQPTSGPPWLGSDRQQTTPTIAARAFPATPTDENMWYQMPGLPYLLKLEERRVPNNPIQPYCQQYQILDNQQANWLPDSNNNPIKIMLNESPPPYVAFQSAAANAPAKRNDAGACHCQWMHGNPG